ncbi:MAG TPA: 2TM domain-containing protein [Candidatus Dormibacteraeota bacterium]|nr:2TM domain-containing protein [Candidatus Dormibacteraeota bacterium]
MSVTPEEDLRAEARRRVRERREFPTHLLTYVLVNGVLIAIWAMSGQGFFWPGIVMAGWGVGVVMHAWNVYAQRPVTEADVDRELERMRHMT